MYLRCFDQGLALINTQQPWFFPPLLQYLFPQDFETYCTTSSLSPKFVYLESTKNDREGPQ